MEFQKEFVIIKTSRLRNLISIALIGSISTILIIGEAIKIFFTG